MGIFSQTLAGLGIIEVGGRKSLHGHGVVWTASSPELLAKLASDEQLWVDMAEALETQIKGEVGVEVYLINKLQKVLHVKGPRATFVHGKSCLTFSKCN